MTTRPGRSSLSVLASAALALPAAGLVTPAHAGSLSVCLEKAETSARVVLRDVNRNVRTKKLRHANRVAHRRVDRAEVIDLLAGYSVRLRVPVDVHVIVGRRSDRGPGRARITRQLAYLNKAYAGRQSPASQRGIIEFYLNRLTRTVNPRWFTAGSGSEADRQMRRRLRTGDRSRLNVFVNEPRKVDGVVTLGWATYPWDIARNGRLDGITIHAESMPGGRLAGYNRGDTLVHETGHWLGLLHTFQGGCAGPGDFVDDTPAEGNPSGSCASKDSCDLPGTDPVHNFMDYAPDTCMNMFTSGQVVRMTHFWLAYRTP